MRITFDFLSMNINNEWLSTFRYSTDRERLMFRHLILENLLETLESSILRMQKLEIKFDQNDETKKVMNMFN